VEQTSNQIACDGRSLPVNVGPWPNDTMLRVVSLS
jgi:hypothetical protein